MIMGAATAATAAGSHKAKDLINRTIAVRMLFTLYDPIVDDSAILSFLQNNNMK